MNDVSTTPAPLICPHCDRAATGVPGDRCPEDGRVLVPSSTRERFPTDPVLGRVLGFDLRVFDVLADTGGFGRVYRALQPALQREVVIKVLRPHVAERDGARARMMREARVLARLSHVPGIVTVHDCFTTEDDLLCLVMARAPGQTLRRVLADGPLTPDRARILTAAILEALQAAHAHGLVHRDLKPGNILVDDDRVTLIDFGIAKDLAPEDDDVRTASGVHLGTPRYMAPEQLQRGGAIGPATDLYAVGVVLYEMLTGQTPFDGSAAELMAAHLYSPPPPVFDAALDEVIQRALQKTPSGRHPDADTMRQALFAGATPRHAAGEATRTGTLEGLGEPLPPRRPPWLWIIAAGLVGLAALGLALMPSEADQAAQPVVPVAAGTVPSSAPEAEVRDARVLDAQVDAARVQDAAMTPDVSVPDAAPVSRIANRPRRRPVRRRVVPASVTSGAPRSVVSVAPARATPSQIAAVRAALKICRCDRARVELKALRGTVDEKRWRAAVKRCRPKLVGQKCAYSEP